MTVNHLHLASHSGFAADATVTNDGRVDISIDETDPAKLASLLTLPSKASTDPEKTQDIDSTPSTTATATATTPLNIVIQVVGSRGDVQPFVALGRVLQQQHGHRVRLVTHSVFCDFVQSNGLEFYDIGGGDPAELMSFMVNSSNDDGGSGLVPPPETFNNGEIASRRRFIEAVLDGCWRSMVDSEEDASSDSATFVADAIIANPPSFAHVHIAESLGIPLHVMFTMPWTPTRSFPHPLANIKFIQPSSPAYKVASLLSYTLVECLTWQGLGDIINRFRVDKLGLESLSPLMAVAPFSQGGLMGRLQIPTTYCWSPALLPKPVDWAPEVSVAGYFFTEETGAEADSYTPSPELAAFIKDGPPPVYIGFGSIVVDDPAALTQTVLDAVNKLKSKNVRAIVSKGWGGLGDDLSKTKNKNVFLLEQDCPHEWLFPRMACVVHHGGAGTTAAGLRAGLPTVVVPFFGDQPFWGDLVAQAGAGPRPIPYPVLTGDRLATAIEDALLPEAREQAKILGSKIREGNGTVAGAASFHRHLPQLYCQVAPEKPAVWTYKAPLQDGEEKQAQTNQTKPRRKRKRVPLSALAAAVLVEKKKMAFSDLRLLRPKEYDIHTDDQPWDPVTGAGSAIVGDLTSIAMAVADFPRELFKKGADSKGNADTDANTNTKGESAKIETASATVTMDTAVQATKSVGRIVTTGLQSPLNFCTGMARGFHNAPRLYNDDTVRNLPGRRRTKTYGHESDDDDDDQEQITSLGSGIRAASKAFGYGLYDGITGLVTQPMNSSGGGLSGFAKGLGGIVLKPAAGAWAVPAYAMQGVHAEVQRIMDSLGGHVGGDSRKATDARRVAARVQQGVVELAASTPDEQQAILAKWVDVQTA
ncbi:udp- transferase [Ophiostoma piceae UAMH 11346]|uniref:Udp-transferase n=1 Tax=Ophiostoma piceae (strain UAMH 11346) TaxID=1262450 RepID=S3CGL1_OPHP1|nr:udp- transferase [Ophiostoma piceae UAMH 11346]